MKIVIDARVMGSKPSGVGIYIYNFIKALQQYPDVELVLLSDVAESEPIQTCATLPRVKVTTYGKPVAKSLGVYPYFSFVQKQVLAEAPDYFWEPNNLIPVRIKNPTGKVVVTIHDIFPITMPECFMRLYPPYFRHGVNTTLRYADMVLYDAMETRDAVHRHFKKAKEMPYHVAYAIVEVERKLAKANTGAGELAEANIGDDELAGDNCERASAGIDGAVSRLDACDAPSIVENNNAFLYIGNLERRKGTDILLRAYAEYVRRGGKKSLRLAGKVREDEIQGLLEETTRQVADTINAAVNAAMQATDAEAETAAQTTDTEAETAAQTTVEATNVATPAAEAAAQTTDAAVQYLGYITEEQKLQEYAACHTFVFPSRAEGFGMPVMEALAFGKPILLSDIGIFKELFEGVGTMFHLSVENLAAIMLATDNTQDKKMQAADNVLDRYCAATLGDQLHTYFLENIKNTNQ